jgi:hypothetical protein
VGFEHAPDLVDLQQAGQRQEFEGQREAADDVLGPELGDVRAGAVPRLYDAQGGEHPHGLAQRPP